MAFWTDMLRYADGRFSVGPTDALETRMALHAAGRGSTHIAEPLPVTLALRATFPTREGALAASRQARPSTTLRTDRGCENADPFVLSVVEARAAEACTRSGHE